MNALKMRADASELQYARERELQFRVDTRSKMLLALWAAEKLGEVDPNAYADELLTEDIIKNGGAVERLTRDFAEAGMSVTAEEIQSRLAATLRQVAADMAA
ncbi:MAG TPA: ATPase inhibitor subunit zeta [Ensifer sp.]|nr:ATPase inhibitor subunit zeta [Ensifer sp.]